MLPFELHQVDSLACKMKHIHSVYHCHHAHQFQTLSLPLRNAGNLM